MNELFNKTYKMKTDKTDLVLSDHNLMKYILPSDVHNFYVYFNKKES